MLSKDTHSIRGESERQVEVKVKEFIFDRRLTKNEDWEADDIDYHPARLFNYKPYSCVLHLVGSYV